MNTANTEAAKALYENYNALFFNASEENGPKKRYELFVTYLRTKNFSAFVELMSKYDVTNESYRLWVQTWKQNYRHLTRAIRLTKVFRKSSYLKEIGAPAVSGWYSSHGEMEYFRHQLRAQARNMMELRMDAKEARKAHLASIKVEDAA